MNKYYFLGCSLPVITIGERPEISFYEMQGMLKLNLSKGDYQKNIILKSYIDIKNLRLLWEHREIDPRGNLNAKELEDTLLIQDILPEYVYEFLEKYNNNEDRIKNFPQLKAKFFYNEVNQNEGFLHYCFKFERDYRLLLTALRAKRLKKDLSRELQFEDQYDDLIVYLLAQKDADSIEVPDEYSDLKRLYDENVTNPKDLHRVLLEYRFKKMEEMTEFKPFTIDYILGYLAKLMIVEDYASLDENKGKATVESLI